MYSSPLLHFRHKILQHRLQFYSIFFLTYIFFFFEVVVKIFDFWLLTVFWCSTSYIKNVTWKTLMEFFYFCSLIALSIAKIYFWPAKTRKKPKLLEMHTCLWPGAQMCFRQKWRLAIGYLLFYFIVLMVIVASVFDTEIFSSLFQVSDWSLLVVYIDVKACNWIPKVIWRRLVFFGVLYQNMPRIVDFISEWTEIWTRCSFNFLF